MKTDLTRPAGEKMYVPPPESLMRRVPSQERGLERVDKLLDAAADVIAEVGVEGATTNAIAARAKTSVGSLYQFFPHKNAIVSALAARYNMELRAINEQVSPLNAAKLLLPEVIDRIVDPFAEFFERNPAYRYIYHAMQSPTGPSCEEAELHQLVVARVENFLELRQSPAPSEDRYLQSTVMVLASHALLSYAMTTSPEMRIQMIAELKRWLVVYIERVLGIE